MLERRHQFHGSAVLRTTQRRLTAFLLRRITAVAKGHFQGS
jgi:hypothetical protein